LKKLIIILFLILKVEWKTDKVRKNISTYVRKKGKKTYSSPAEGGAVVEQQIEVKHLKYKIGLLSPFSYFLSPIHPSIHEK